MTMQLDAARVESLPEALRAPIQKYTDLLAETIGERLQTLTVFGAAAVGAFDPRHHVVRNVITLSEVDLVALRQLSLHGATLGQHAIAAPLIMTPTYIHASLDVFPLELLEIQQAHVTLIGDDPFAELSFAEDDVRLQCERELKSLLIGLRQGLLASVGEEKFLAGLRLNAAETLARTLRGLLWLKGKREPLPAKAVLQEVESMTERSLPGIKIAFSLEAEHGWAEFTALYHDVAALGEVADGW